MSERGSTTYAFADPLGSSGPGGTRLRVRRVHAAMYGLAALLLGASAGTESAPAAERATVLAIAAAMVLFALAMLWRRFRAPDVLLVAAFPLAALTVTVIAVVDPPLALTPMFYVWPLMTSAYFLSRRAAAAVYATACGSFAACAPLIEPVPSAIQVLTVALVGALVLLLVLALRDGMTRLIVQLSTLAREDPLTGTLNRRALLEQVDAELARARRTSTPVAVAVVDVDHFKRINDHHGHAAGDDTLRRLVAAIEGRLRAGDVLGRLGGEEFAVVLAGTDAAGAAAYADDLREHLACLGRDGGLPFTVSIGVAACEPALEPAAADRLLAAADDALYRAKHAGRNAVRVAAAA